MQKKKVNYVVNAIIESKMYSIDDCMLNPSLSQLIGVHSEINNQVSHPSMFQCYTVNVLRVFLHAIQRF